MALTMMIAGRMWLLVLWLWWLLIRLRSELIGVMGQQGMCQFMGTEMETGYLGGMREKGGNNGTCNLMQPYLQLM